jgi:hypothetical protein
VLHRDAGRANRLPLSSRKASGGTLFVGLSPGFPSFFPEGARIQLLVGLVH